ncbi:hypothetical protein A3K34_01185 [candidate division WWE3 bacterium RIFOXYC1_FULL_40_10]|uniref:histidine kinase n=1 Tax=candidate division WWE3 bacterium RIFOXYA2_FULL_46_9 TaxID=1802636 RepID=A0A1F4W1X6_UNCKA|nr:MAG: hypothetical protein A3K58_01185 [candidate division WWE3 bacterium RIFOXYB1_FULL_40_22]OGC61483.1 MAG: hypothetical protein A3K37_01185 [candidate division WWE3 bacterium RIFOXYA1_FULL_40_11]OGC63416.1 MAG: hypothetical protein A2264_01665 [candidate division WWE3 bacterium RIFOXYA2_FULL_46_9]OGC64554.1 MAG: hypothetical protein A2326_03580 [candidate division WWE3 bacterium RIFOXYB2_FULL_41_6]OGC65866.1 MAG: hypothetical protein A3K34_01185 [candidate division WWE3 bacterium RIFOXYC1_
MAAQKFSLTSYENLQSLWKLERLILDSLDFHTTTEQVVNSILTELNYLDPSYKVAVLALIDQENQVLKRVALSQTQEAKKTREVSNVPFEKIITPLSAKQNLCIKAMDENKTQITDYFPDILTPPISPENAIESQKNAGLKSSLIFPLQVRGKTIGIMIFSLTKNTSEIQEDEKELLGHFTDLVALAVQNSKLYSQLDRDSRELALANDKLQILDKTKDDFMSVASHELRTPMTIIKSYLWMLRNGKAGDLNPKQQEYLLKTANSTERMINLINDMLNISRIEQGRMKFTVKRIDICKTIDEAVDGFELKTKEKNIYLKIENTCKGVMVYTDEDKIKESIINLLGNALKFTKQGGITVSTEEEGNFVKVKVTDTGAGLSTEDQQRLFKKFGRLDNSYQTVAESGGTGLGLFIVKTYIEKMGGEVGVYSAGTNKGSTFWITISKTRPNIEDGEINQVEFVERPENEPITTLVVNPKKIG